MSRFRIRMDRRSGRTGRHFWRCERTARDAADSTDVPNRSSKAKAAHPQAAGEVAILGGVGDAVAHVVEPALIDQIDDELHLVDAFEVRHLRRIAGLDQGLESGLDE